MALLQIHVQTYAQIFVQKAAPPFHMSKIPSIPEIGMDSFVVHDSCQRKSLLKTYTSEVKFDVDMCQWCL